MFFLNQSVALYFTNIFVLTFIFNQISILLTLPHYSIMVSWFDL